MIGESGTLDDVCIINDTLAYAVGELYVRDSLGQWDPQAYNIAVWSGNHWSMRRVRILDSCSIVEYPPLTGIWALSGSEIYLVHATGIASFDGTAATSDCRMYPLLSSSLEKVYAASANDVYAIGRLGTIVHFDGVAWRRVEIGSSRDARGIYGSRDPFTDRLTILAIAAGRSPTEGKQLIQIQGNTATTLSDSGLLWPPSTVWFVPAVMYYVAGPGIYFKKDLSEAVWTGYPAGEITTWATSDLRGNSANDVFAVGSGYEVLHYNGSTWCNYRNQIASTEGVFARIAIRGNLAITVGFGGNRGAVAVGRR